MEQVKAFPTAADNGHSENQDGMTLRDYFAAKTMQSMIEASVSLNDNELDSLANLSFEMAVMCGVCETVDVQGEEKDGTPFQYTWARYYAEEAYSIADEMMKAREIKNG